MRIWAHVLYTSALIPLIRLMISLPLVTVEDFLFAAFKSLLISDSYPVFV